MNYKIIDNALSKNDFKKIKDFVFNDNFSWSFSGKIGSDEEKLPIHRSYYFVHHFWNGIYVQPEIELLVPVLNLLKVKSVIKIKANLYPSTDKVYNHGVHIDQPYPHHGAILYLNTNDGFTVMEGEKKVESVENRILVFDSSKPHNSTSCTDKQCRVNINFNFF